MDVTDWGAAKAIWQAIKGSGLDLYDGVVVYVGVGPDQSLDILVQDADDLDLSDPDLIQEMQDRIGWLEQELHAQIKTESHIETWQKALPNEP